MSLSEQRSSSRCMQRTPHRYRSPHLPTPEPSRSSNEAFELPSEMRALHKGPQIYEHLLQQSFDQALSSIRGPTDSHMDRHVTSRQPAPQSPPYRTTDSQKPSLPPLKMVSTTSINARKVSDSCRCLATTYQVHLKHRPQLLRLSI